MDEQKTTEQITVKEANMTETEQEKAEVTQQEAAPEPQGEILEKEVALEAEQPTEAEPETTPEAEANTVQGLAQLMKSCWVGDEEGEECTALGAEFDKAAKELNIPIGKLIDQVFELAKKAGTEDCTGK